MLKSPNKKSFERPLKKANNATVILPPSKWIFLEKIAYLESSGVGFLMKFQYQSFWVTFIFGPYLMVGAVDFWLGWFCSLCYGQIEAGPKFLGMNWSIRV